MFTADASVLRSDFFQRQGHPSGTRDRRDPSYQRPLGVSPGGA
ncbi:hypothetical protein [Prauserella endophytica]|nr:hypothetical protein [Prauserella endophytica]